MTKIICLFLSILPAFSGDLNNNKEFNRFLDALAFVESSNNPKAYNSKEGAIGIYQIRNKYFLDAQNFNPKLKKYSHKNAFRPEIAKIIVISYFQKYEQNNLNKENWEALARCHNSGPGWKSKKSKTEKYWNKVKKELAHR